LNPANPRLVLATANGHKIAEIRAIMGHMPIDITDILQIGGIASPEETGATLEENALIKARAVHHATGLWTLADDSGLEIDALDGAPGVFSARYAGPACSFADNNAKVLQLLDDVADVKRTARFVCAAALIGHQRDADVFVGIIEGRITREPRGPGGFGYDPIFFVPELGRTFAQATPAEKNGLSHRGVAFRTAAQRLRELAVKSS